MKKHLTNAIYGALDYASYPLGMLAVAPIVLHRLGAAEYGLWMVSTSVVSAGGITASGFCDAGLQRIACLRASGKPSQMLDVIRGLFAISLSLGSLLAAAVWIAAPHAAGHIAHSSAVSLHECMVCLRIASVFILLRSVEAVAVTTQRAFEEYRGTVQVSTAVRLGTLAFAAAAPFLALRTQGIMAVSAVIFAVGVLLQFRLLRSHVGSGPFWPRVDLQETRTLFTSGIFVWLQATGSVIFRQLDRIALGIALGAVAVAPYAICIQFSEPLFGLTASGLSFFFPYLSGRASVASARVIRRSVLKAAACNLVLVLTGGILLFTLGHRFLNLWAGPAVAARAQSLLPMILFGSALSGLSVTGTYAMQALRQFRTLAFLSIGSRTALLMAMLYLLHHRGVQGLALSRLYYGIASLLVYLPLVHQLRSLRKQEQTDELPLLGPELRGGVQP